MHDISESFDTIKEIAEYLSNNPSIAIEVEKSIKELQENKADKATTLAGYGITDALSKSGGTIASDNVAPLSIKRNGTGGAFISFENDNGRKGYVGISNTNELYLFAGDQIVAGSRILHESNYATFALHKTGGTIIGKSNVPLYIATSETSQCVIVFQSSNNAKTSIGWSNSNGSYIYNYATSLRIGIKDDGTPYFGSDILIHSGNIGDYAALSYGVVGANYASSNWLGYTYATDEHGGAYAGGIISCGTDRAGFQLNGSATGIALAFRGRSSDVWGNWKTIAFTDSNVASATKLQTARTIWGQSFDGTNDINGDIDLKNNNIKFTNFTITNSTLAFIAATEGWNRGIAIKSTDNTLLGQIGIQGNSNELRYIHLSAGDWSTDVSLRLWDNGNVTIGQTTNTSGYKLQVEGSAKFTGDILLNNNRNIYFKNSENAAVPLITLNSGNIFALGYGTIAKDYNIRIFGSQIYFCYTETSTAFYVSKKGNIIVNNGIYLQNNQNIYFADIDKNYNTVLSLTENNILKLGEGSCTQGYNTNIYGNIVNIATRDGEKVATAIQIDWSGTVNLLRGSLLLANAQTINFKDNAGDASSFVPVLHLTTANQLYIGRGSVDKGYDTYLYGRGVYIYGRNESSLTNIAYFNSNSIQLYKHVYIGSASSKTMSLLYTYGNAVIGQESNSNNAYIKLRSANGNIELRITSASVRGLFDYKENKWALSVENDGHTYTTIGDLFITNGNVRSNYSGYFVDGLYVNDNIVLHAGNYADYTGTSSDRRLKSEINTITDSEALSVLTQLNPVTFIWNAVATSLKQSLIGESSGFISDEYESVIPNSGYDMWDKQYRGIDYTRVSSYLVAGWQNHERRISDMEDKTSEIAKLKKIIEDATQKISALKSQLNNN